MNIGIDIGSIVVPELTGVGQYTIGLLNELFKVDRENKYVLFYNSAKDISSNLPKFDYNNVVVCATRFPNKLLHSSIALLNKPKIESLINNKIDVFFSPNLHFTSLRPETKHIITIHDLSFKLFPEYFSKKRLLWHHILAPSKQCMKADAIIVPSEHTKHDVLKYFSIEQEKVHVISPAITPQIDNKEDIHSLYNLPEKFILFLGTIEPRKNIISAIEAFEKSGLADEGYEFIIAGGRGWKCTPIFKKIKKTHAVQYIGFVNESHKHALYSSADIFVYPSFYEGFGLPVLESFLAGTPVITSNTSSLPDVASGAAYLINPHNISEISFAMQKLSKDKKLRSIFSENGRKVIQKFSWDIASRKFLEIIKNI